MTKNPDGPFASDVSRRDILLGAAASVVGLEQLASAAEKDAGSRFLVKPYVQFGDAPQLARQEQLVVMWHASDRDGNWAVEFRPAGGAAWSRAAEVSATRVAVETIPEHYVYRATLRPLPPGTAVEYRVLRGGSVAFAVRARARHAADQPFRCVVAGDWGTGSEQQKRVAFQLHRQQPDFVFVPGDLVYNDGRISEYRSSFFPVYSVDAPSPEQGSPLMSSTVILGGRGQHDTQASLARNPDGQAYFLYWSFPLNGPALEAHGNNVWPLDGPPPRNAAIREGAGHRFPRMANYSFDWGNSHWTVLDTWNPHVDWTDPLLRAWLKEDLAAARHARWKFVSSYMPPFNSSTKFPQGQKMRVIADLLEEAGVDIVFSGYAHSYQRTYPLRFTPDAPPVGPVKDPAQQIPGRFRFDTKFDGREHAHADGVLYIVSGCGGNPHLHSPEQTDNPQTWQPFTVKYHASLHQFTRLDIDGPRLSLHQISLDGNELDQLTIIKSA